MRYAFAICVAFVAFWASASAYAETYTCPAGRLHGDRVEYEGDAFRKSEDGVHQDAISYSLIDKNNAVITYRERKENASIINYNQASTTLSYTFNGVSYMDTIYHGRGVVYSTLHKYITSGSSLVPTITTWHMAGCVRTSALLQSLPAGAR